MSDDRLQNIERDVTEIKVILAVNTQLLGQQGEQLTEHMRRTEANEELIQISLTPIKFFQRLAHIIKWTIGLGATAAAIYTIFQ